jgi:hypothetical protein
MEDGGPEHLMQRDGLYRTVGPFAGGHGGTICPQLEIALSQSRSEYCFLYRLIHPRVVERDWWPLNWASSGRTPSTSARTTRRSTSGSSTITPTRSTSLPTTASNWCRPSARRTCRARTARISTGRHSLFMNKFRKAGFIQLQWSSRSPQFAARRGVIRPGETLCEFARVTCAGRPRPREAPSNQ